MPLGKNIEEALFDLVKTGDENAFEMLFKLFYHDLCQYAVIYVKAPEIAEDIVQETFIHIWEKRSTITIEHTTRGYLYKAIHNECINFLNKDRVWKNRAQDIKEEILLRHQAVSQNLDPNMLDKLVSDEIADKINVVLTSLPDQCRKIFLMSREDQITYQEISKKLNISLNTVKTQMRRALKRLHDDLDQYLI